VSSSLTPEGERRKDGAIQMTRRREERIRRRAGGEDQPEGKEEKEENRKRTHSLVDPLLRIRDLLLDTLQPLSIRSLALFKPDDRTSLASSPGGDVRRASKKARRT
jgi:hypothetical protein